jgi:hypothetical protein
VTSIDYSAAVGAFTTETAARLRALALRGRFEAHLTVDTDDAAAFDDACRALGVDCVLIALSEGAHRAQPMTASHHEGELARVLDEVDALHAALEARGLRIVRAKLEAHVENAGIPPSDADAAALGGYFEYHLKVKVGVLIRGAPREPRDPALAKEDLIAKIRALGVEVNDHMSSLDAEDVARIKRAVEDEHLAKKPTAAQPLRAIAVRHGAHVSANDRKPGQRFVTLRVYRASLAEAESRLAALERAIADAGFAITGTIREYTLADTRIELDAGWLDAPRADTPRARNDNQRET